MDLDVQQLLDPKFSDAPPPGYIRRAGPIFRAGNYPDKQFSLSAQEMDQAIASFSPVPGDLEHTPTVLSGKVGVMRRIWREGDTLMGQADVPQWLDDALGDTKRKVSLAWDRAKKTVQGWGWVLEPRISDAALMSAYAQFTARQTQALTQAAQAAAPSVVTIRQQKRERVMPLIDKIREHLEALSGQQAQQSQQGQIAFNIGSPQPTTPAPTPTPTPATPPTPTPAPTPLPPATGPNTPTTPATPTPAPTTPTTPTTQFSAPGVAPTQAGGPMDEGMVEFRSRQILTQATDIVDGLIREGVLHSSGRSAAIALFTCAGLDNEESGPTLVTFTNASNVVVNDRVQMLKEVFKSVPRHALFSPGLPVHLLNGAPDPSERLSPEEIGRRQAEEFNQRKAQQLGIAQGAPASTPQNGHK